MRVANSRLPEKLALVGTAARVAVAAVAAVAVAIGVAWGWRALAVFLFFAAVAGVTSLAARVGGEWTRETSRRRFDRDDGRR